MLPIALRRDRIPNMGLHHLSWCERRPRQPAASASAIEKTNRIGRRDQPPFEARAMTMGSTFAYGGPDHEGRPSRGPHQPSDPRPVCSGGDRRRVRYHNCASSTGLMEVPSSAGSPVAMQWRKRKGDYSIGARERPHASDLVVGLFQGRLRGRPRGGCAATYIGARRIISSVSPGYNSRNTSGGPPVAADPQYGTQGCGFAETPVSRPESPGPRR
jgi:hypothetical protein